MVDEGLFLDCDGEGVRFAGEVAAGFGLVDEYLGYLLDRNYSVETVKTYGYGLLAFCRWLWVEKIELSAVSTDVLLRFLAACRREQVRGRPGPNVVRLDGRRSDSLSPATVNLRLAAISGLFAYWGMRDPQAPKPVPKGREARWLRAGERSGLLAHVSKAAKRRSPLRLREANRLPKRLERDEVVELLESLRTWRDRAIAGLMVFCGLRSGEVLSLDVADVDIGGRWLTVMGKGSKERRVPLDVDVAGVIQTYLLVERPETASGRLFIVAKGPTRGEPLKAAGLRAIFRYHRHLTGITKAHPHALRHTFGSALAEAGVDLVVVQALLGHSHVDTTSRYIHLSPTYVKAEFDAARSR